MKLLFVLKNGIEDIYSYYPAITGYIVRFVVSFASLMVLRGNIGFNEILSNIFFVILFAAVCSFIPMRFMLLAVVAYAVVQVFSLTVGLGIIACILFVIMYVMYYRFDEKMGFVILLVPLLCMIRLPILIPLILAVMASAGSVLGALLGYIAYYFLHYLHVNMAVFLGTDKSEIEKMSMALKGLFTYRELWYTLICVLIVFFAVYYLKKVTVNKSNLMAIAVGSGLYLILILISNLLFGTISYTKLIWLAAGCLLSCFLAMIITGVLLPLDYSRTEFLEFEDEEYKYYVRAVPKAIMSRESIRIKRIYSRKQLDHIRGRGEQS